MSSSYQILFDGQAADADFYTSIASLEVEENMDLPGAVQLNLPVNRSDSGDLTYLADSRFKPLANIAVVATPAAGLAGRLNCGQEEPDQDADDADHHQQLDQSKALTAATTRIHERSFQIGKMSQNLILSAPCRLPQAQPAVWSHGLPGRVFTGRMPVLRFSGQNFRAGVPHTG